MSFPGCQISPSAIIGAPSEPFLRRTISRLGHAEMQPRPDTVSIANGVIIMAHVVICHDVVIGADCFIEDMVRIGYATKIGRGTRINCAANISERIQIGEDCRISGFICEGTIIENQCAVFGQVMHSYTRPDIGWWEHDEPSPRILHGSTIGMNASVIGGISVGPFSYVVAGATVTKDVPPQHVAIGTNEFIHRKDWRGRKLQDYLSWVAGQKEILDRLDDGKSCPTRGDPSK